MCTRASNRALLRGPSTSPLGARLPRRIVLFALCLAFATGCTRDLALALAPDTPVEVIEVGGPHYTVDPGSDTHRQLERWVEHNRSGWIRYDATLPDRGIIVRANSVDLQFLGSKVFAQTPQGAFQKPVAPADYGFIRRIANGT